MKRRLLSISLALALCLTLLPAAAWAADGGSTVAPPDPDEGDTPSQAPVMWEIGRNCWKRLRIRPTSP